MAKRSQMFLLVLSLSTLGLDMGMVYGWDDVSWIIGPRSVLRQPDVGLVATDKVPVCVMKRQ